MRELFVVNHESTETSLVLRTEDGEEFFLDLAALEGSVRAILGFDATGPSENAANASAVDTPTPAEDAKPTSDADASAFTGLSAVDSSTPATTDAASNATDAADGAGTAPGLSVAGASATATGPAQSAHRPLSDRLTMRPPEIQNRIRAGASVADLAMEMNVPESRVEPFAHPILLERARIAELLDGAAEVDESRLAAEVAYFADKANITEELVRLESHIAQLRAMLTGTEPAGRKLDFIVQEMNREMNTIGSKAADLTILNAVIEGKAEIEKIREQVQNIE